MQTKIQATNPHTRGLIVNPKIILPEEENVELLHDETANGRKIDWGKNKCLNLFLADSYHRLGRQDKANRISQCLNYMEIEKVDEKNVLRHAYHCYDTMCPLCGFIRTRKIYNQVSKCMWHIDAHPDDYNFEYVFLTLSIRNPKAEALKETMNQMSNGFKLLCQRKAFKSMAQGWFRAIELTHNWINDDYHPHYHVLIAVDKKYFKTFENYVTHDEFKQEWQKCMGLDYEPYIHITKVKESKKKETDKSSSQYWNAVAEVAKYTLKSNDYLVVWPFRESFTKLTKGKVKIRSKKDCERLTDEVVSVVSEALYNRRLVAFGGEFKKIHKALNLDDPIDGDLLDTNSEEEKTTVHDTLLRYEFKIGFGDYVLVHK